MIESMDRESKLALLQVYLLQVSKMRGGWRTIGAVKCILLVDNFRQKRYRWWHWQRWQQLYYWLIACILLGKLI